MLVRDLVKIMLKKRGLTQQWVVNRINELGLSEGEKMHKFHFSTNMTTNKITPFLARKIEIALDLSKYYLVKMVGMPTTEKGIKKLEEIDKKVEDKLDAHIK